MPELEAGGRREVRELAQDAGREGVDDEAPDAEVRDRPLEERAKAPAVAVEVGRDLDDGESPRDARVAPRSATT